MTKPAAPRLVVAMDYDSLEPYKGLLSQLDPAFCRVKIGKELFTACGPQVVEYAQNLGFDVFLDLKFHDIPVTVAKAVKAAAALGVWMVNVHASGGARMLEAAREAANSGSHQPLLIGVTVLTSMTEDEMQALGVTRALAAQVEHLADSAKQCGFDGIVCSAREAAALKKACGDEFLLVTPGIRPEGAAVDDQRRILTPEQAVASGSDYLVVGRPITAAEDPLAACQAICRSIESAQSR